MEQGRAGRVYRERNWVTSMAVCAIALAWIVTLASPLAHAISSILYVSQINVNA